MSFDTPAPPPRLVMTRAFLQCLYATHTLVVAEVCSIARETKVTAVSENERFFTAVDIGDLMEKRVCRSLNQCTIPHRILPSLDNMAGLETWSPYSTEIAHDNSPLASCTSYHNPYN